MVNNTEQLKEVPNLIGLVEQYRKGELKDIDFVPNRRPENREYLYINKDGKKDLIKYKELKGIGEYTTFGKINEGEKVITEGLMTCLLYSGRMVRRIIRIINKNIDHSKFLVQDWKELGIEEEDNENNY